MRLFNLADRILLVYVDIVDILLLGRLMAGLSSSDGVYDRYGTSLGYDESDKTNARRSLLYTDAFSYTYL
jgi:hypothetical protein